MRRAMLLYLLLFPACGGSSSADESQHGGSGGMEMAAGSGGLGGSVGSAGSGGDGPTGGERSGAGGSMSAPLGGSGGAGGSVLVTRATVLMKSPPSCGGCDDPFSGRVTFTQLGTGNISIEGAFENCGSMIYQIAIYEGDSCLIEVAPGKTSYPTEIWDKATKRGEINAYVYCDGVGTLSFEHVNSPGKEWTIGDGSSTDIVGRVLQIHGKSCGVIE